MFKLSIECTKDISEMHINFTDGTSAMVENTSKSRNIPQALKKSTNSAERKNFTPLKPLTSDELEVNQEKIHLPDIKTCSRPVKVAEELQNLDL